MKRKWYHPKSPDSSRTHWRSIGELEGSEEFQGWLEREFPRGAAEMEMDDVSRRNFVKLMGASTALAGFGVACSRPERHLVPYNEHVEWEVPGRALYYSTAKPRLGGVGCEPLVVTTFEGRPTKVDGNRLHPRRAGGSDAFTQASILNLYDQDRSRGYLHDGKPTVAREFEEGFLKGFRAAAKGAKTAFVLPRSSSPTRNGLLSKIADRYRGAKFFCCEALEGSGHVEASKKMYGAGVVAVPRLDRAEKILSLDCDFLGTEPLGEDTIAEFSKGRSVDDPKGKMNRLYAAESAFTLTGGQADHRYRIATSQILPLAVLIGKELGISSGLEGKVNASVYNEKWIRECAADLLASKGKALVVAGARQPKEVHLLVAAMNQVLGAFGAIIELIDHALPEMGGVADLAKAIQGGQVETLIVANEGDLVFDAPADLNLGDLLTKKVSQVIHLGMRVNETARAANWHVPGAHYLESWGDFWSHAGVYSVQQPMIHPLWGGVSEIEFLLALLADEKGQVASPLDEVKATFAKIGGKNWTETLRDGFAKGPALPVKKVGDIKGKIAASVASASVADLPYPGALEVTLTTSGSVYDGRFANNGWLQEAPDPITKLTWDNAALISIATAEKLGLEDGDLVELNAVGKKVKAPILRSPGHADYAVSLALGYYGNRATGAVSSGVGFNAYPLKTTTQPYWVQQVTLSKTGKKYPLALSAEHYSMEGRAIVREGTAEMLKEEPDFASHQGMDAHIPENIPLYLGPDYLGRDKDDPNRNEKNAKEALEGHAFWVDPQHQWGMTIDLNSCIGCNSCVIACQAENNIPIVGKDQVIRGREMHWIRMDRYFTSPKDYEIVSERGTVFDYVARGSELETPGLRKVDDDAVEMLTQPVACQQCESAPCETVCPVNATVHTSDGLNAMTYNRCIGTRYCANNCPYKARRFNFYDYNKRPLDQLSLGPLAPVAGNATTSQQLQKNPNVTVRMRGVIEKCTYCVQRISAAKIAAKVAARDSKDTQVPANSFTVACQDACPAGSIVFGNLKNPKDRVTQIKANNGRNYDLLKYIGTLPRTSYLARIKNPNPKMPGAGKVGVTTSKMH